VTTMRLKEDISVVASFGRPYKVRPVRFRWNGRLLEVKEVTYRWSTMEGRAVVHHFAVTDGNSAYEITFNSQTLLWRIESMDESEA